MRLDQLPIILPTVVAGLAIAGWAARGLRRMWRLMSKANRWLDQVLGEPARDGRPATPSLMQRVEQIEEHQAGQAEVLAAHLRWHGEPGGAPAASPVPGPRNGGARAVQNSRRER